MRYDKRDYDILEVAHHLGVEIIRTEGATHRAVCSSCGADSLILQPAKARYFCNGCNNTGDVADLVRLVLDCDFATAIKWLCNLFAFGKRSSSLWLDNLFASGKRSSNMRFDNLHGSTCDNISDNTDYHRTLSQWEGMLPHRQRELTPDSPAGQYLLGRGLHPDTWRVWGMGAGYWGKDKHPSVIFPWYSPGGRIVGISHRLLNPPTPRDKAPWQSGMSGHTSGLLCGWHTHSGRYGTLYVVEGILNAPSLWQIMKGIVDVLTPGTANYTFTPENIELVGRWEQVFVIADNRRDSLRWAEQLRLPTDRAMCCRRDEKGVKLDVNELLQRGWLSL